MSWHLEGSYFETCSCDVICPCTASMALEATPPMTPSQVFPGLSQGMSLRRPSALPPK